MLKELAHGLSGMGAAAALAASSVGCAAVETEAPGAVMLVMTTDAPASGSSLTFDRVEVVIDDPRVAVPHVRSFAIRPSDLPETLTIAAKPGQTGVVTRIQVFAFEGQSNLRVYRAARVVLPPSGIEMLRMPLNVACDRVYPASICPPDQSCSGTPTKVCSAAETCVEGRCEVVEVPAGKLPGYTVGAEAACTAESVASQCAGAGKTCGALTSADTCGEVKTVDCGRCADAGPADAAVDGGTDSGADAGPPDAGPPDAGPTCGAGTYVTGTTCTPCATETFSAGNNASQCTPWKTCTAGQYVGSAGTSASDRVCAGCGAGTFSTGTNAATCTAWTTCQPGEQVGNTPSATGDRVCTSCAAGAFSTATNAAGCTAWTTCAPGQYIGVIGTTSRDQTCPACASGSFSSANNVAVCTGWSACVPGTYVNNTPGATNDRLCSSCGAGTYSAATNAASCTAWATCTAGQYVSTAGSTASDRACAACGAGTFSAAENAATCSAWATCVAGQYVAYAPSATAERGCAACVTGQYSSGNNAATCTTWSNCTAGQYVSTAPSASTNRGCTACVAGQFSSGNNAATCTAWASCTVGQYVSTAPSATTNRGCSACGAGTFSAAGNAANCAAWTVCQGGSYLAVSGSATTDATCTACTPGTYSSTTNAGSCTACGAGTTSGPGATACAAAGSELAATSAAMTGDGVNNCGVSGTDVCARSLLVTGGTFYRGTTTSYPATISDFRLDKYEVTVGRFRKFLDAWVVGWRPAAGSGKHTHLNGGSGLANTAGGYEAGWDATWTAYLGAAWTSAAVPSGPGAANRSEWDTRLNCNASYPVWTSSAGANEKKPTNCVSWYDLYAFCIWDGGFLPSEAEWEYAAAGGSEERKYPWGGAEPGANTALAIYGCYFNAAGSCSGVTNIAPVGTAPAGASKAGQLDLAGNLWEWNLDWYQSGHVTACNNCTNLTAGSFRVARGGSFHNDASFLPSSGRYYGYPAYRYNGYGGRCARTP